MDILVKVSGSLVEDERFYDWLSPISSPFNSLFVLCGGGELITKALKEEEYDFGPQGREIKSLEGKRLALQILQQQKILVEEKLQERGIKAKVDIPVKKFGDKICFINGDIYAAIALYPNFGKIYIVTLKGRTKSFPENLNKIEVVHL